MMIQTTAMIYSYILGGIVVIAITLLAILLKVSDLNEKRDNEKK